jgi:hypothetical protein
LLHASIREIALREVSITTQALEALLRVCPGLTSLKVMECPALMQLQRMQIGTLCPHLQNLLLASNVNNVGDATLLNISKHCADLRVLHIAGTDVSDFALTAIAKKCPLLKSLNISDCASVTDGFLMMLARYGGALRTFDWFECNSITDAGMEAVRAGCPNLKIEFSL